MITEKKIGPKPTSPENTIPKHIYGHSGLLYDRIREIGAGGTTSSIRTVFFGFF